LGGKKNETRKKKTIKSSCLSSRYYFREGGGFLKFKFIAEGLGRKKNAKPLKVNTRTEEAKIEPQIDGEKRPGKKEEGQSEAQFTRAKRALRTGQKNRGLRERQRRESIYMVKAAFDGKEA